MEKTMRINGETFEVIRPRKYPVRLSNPHYLRDLYDCYDSPSAAKQSIYNEWYEWYRSDDRLSEFGITSYNTFSFSLGCVFIDDETGVQGYIAITPAHNRIYIAGE